MSNSHKPNSHQKNPFEQHEEWQAWFEQDQRYLSKRDEAKSKYFNPSMSHNTSTQTQTFSWWTRYRLPLISAFSIIGIITLVASIAFFAGSNSLTKEVAKTQTETKKDSPTLEEFANSKKASVIKVDYLNFDKDESDIVRAGNRIELLTNGTSIEQIKETENKLPDTTGGNAPRTQAPVVDSTTQPKQVNLNQQEAAQLVTQNKIEDDKIWYTESEEYSDPNYLPYTSDVSVLFDPAKPYKVQTWSTANYFKQVRSQNGKVYDLILTTPEYSLEYKGGTYAIKKVYSEPIYFSGVGYNDNSARNYEIEFYKSLTQGDYWTKTDSIARDGKTYEVYQNSYESDGKTYINRYLIDPVSFRLAYSELVQNNQVILSSKFALDTQQDVATLDDVFNAQQIKDKPIKTVTTKNDTSFKESNRKDEYPAYAKEFTLLYDSSLKDNTQFDFDIFDSRSNDEYNELVNSKDFDPLFNPVYNYSFPGSIAVFYSQSNLTVTTVNQYYTILKSASDAERYVDYTFGSTNNRIPLETSITINGKQVASKGYTYAYTSNDGATQYGSSLVIFEYNKSYYAFSSYDNYGQPSLKFDLTVLDAQTLNNIGQRMDKKYNSIVYVKQLNNIESVPENTRYVSNYINSSPEKIELINVTKTERSPSQSTCKEYIRSFEMIPTCLMERYNGTQYLYSNVNTSDSPFYKSITITILDMQAKDFDINKECTSLGEQICTPVSSGAIKGLSLAYPDSSNIEIIWVGELDGKVVLYESNDMKLTSPDPTALELLYGMSKEYDASKVNTVIAKNYHPVYAY